MTGQGPCHEWLVLHSHLAGDESTQKQDEQVRQLP